MVITIISYLFVAITDSIVGAMFWSCRSTSSAPFLYNAGAAAQHRASEWGKEYRPDGLSTSVLVTDSNMLQYSFSSNAVKIANQKTKIIAQFGQLFEATQHLGILLHNSWLVDSWWPLPASGGRSYWASHADLPQLNQRRILQIFDSYTVYVLMKHNFQIDPFLHVFQ